jgi:hypothetical protein
MALNNREGEIKAAYDQLAALYHANPEFYENEDYSTIFEWADKGAKEGRLNAIRWTIEAMYKYKYLREQQRYRKYQREYRRLYRARQRGSILLS